MCLKGLVVAGAEIQLGECLDLWPLVNIRGIQLLTDSVGQIAIGNGREPGSSMERYKCLQNVVSNPVTYAGDDTPSISIFSGISRVGIARDKYDHFLRKISDFAPRFGRKYLSACRIWALLFCLFTYRLPRFKSAVCSFFGSFAN